MKIVPLNRTFFKPLLKLGHRRIPVACALFVFTQKEIEKAMSVINFVWKKIISSVNEKFVGLIRFDLIPGFSQSLPQISKWQGGLAYDFGFLQIKGVYEVNVHSPECGAALSVIQAVLPEIKQFHPPVASLIGKAISNHFLGEKVSFVIGDGLLKQKWGNFFYHDLSNFLPIVKMSWKEAMKNPSPVIWRWGDARGRNDDEFPLEFQQFLISYQEKQNRMVFNTLPLKKDWGDKSLFCSELQFSSDECRRSEWEKIVGKNFFLNSETLSYALTFQKKLVCKPFLGSSGREVAVGRLLSPKEWKEILKRRINKGYGIFEARWLPRLKLPFGELAIDFNVTCWANGSKLEYLYSFVRIDKWENYWKRGTINVSQGAGLGMGRVLED